MDEVGAAVALRSCRLQRHAQVRLHELVRQSAGVELQQSGTKQLALVEGEHVLALSALVISPAYVLVFEMVAVELVGCIIVDDLALGS